MGHHALGQSARGDGRAMAQGWGIPTLSRGLGWQPAQQGGDEAPPWSDTCAIQRAVWCQLSVRLQGAGIQGQGLGPLGHGVRCCSWWTGSPREGPLGSATQPPR